MGGVPPLTAKNVTFWLLFKGGGGGVPPPPKLSKSQKIAKNVKKTPLRVFVFDLFKNGGFQKSRFFGILATLKSRNDGVKVLPGLTAKLTNFWSCTNFLRVAMMTNVITRKDPKICWQLWEVDERAGCGHIEIKNVSWASYKFFIYMLQHLTSKFDDDILVTSCGSKYATTVETSPTCQLLCGQKKFAQKFF